MHTKQSKKTLRVEAQGFFSDAEVTNASADQPWKRSETDRLLDLYLGGMVPKRIAVELQRNPKAVKRRLEQFIYNERGWVERYEPKLRISRRGMRFTQNETLLLQSHQQRKVDSKDTARLLQRPVSDFDSDVQSKTFHVDAKQVGVGVDLVLAYRCAYYCHHISLVTDSAYDALEKEEIEFGQNGHLLKDKVGSDKLEDYPPHIRALTMYLLFKYAEREKGKK